MRIGGEESAAGNRRAGSEVANRHVLLREMIVKQVLLMLRYRVNFAIQLVGMYLFFAVIFFGGRATLGTAAGGTDSFATTFDGIIVGWFLWTMAQSAYSGLQGEVTAESMWGTLEQLYMSPYGFGVVMAFKAIVNVLLSFFWGAVMLVLMMVTTQRWFTIDVVTIAPIVVFTLMSVLGLGFAIAGLALIYKKVSSVSNLMNFALMGLIAAPVTGVSLLRAFPLAQGSAMLQESMRNGISIWEFSAVDLSLLFGVGTFYLCIGFGVFSYATTVARRRGVMGHY